MDNTAITKRQQTKKALLEAGAQLDECAGAVLLDMCKITYSSPTWDRDRRALITAIDRWRNVAQPGRVSPLIDTSGVAGEEQ